MIIDSHCHAGSGDGLTGPWDTCAALEPYVRRSRAAGITHSVIFPTLTSDYQRANRDVAAIVRRNPQRFTGFAFVNPISDRGAIPRMVCQAVDEWGFRGIKVHWRDGQITREIADVARARRLPVIYDPSGDTGIVEMIARAYPDVAWIIPHLSSFADDWKAQVAFVDQLTRIPNVFTDTSGVRYFDVLADAARRAGPHKILFGTDGPFLHPAVELAKITALTMSDADRGLVLGGNIRRLVRPVRRMAVESRTWSHHDRSPARTAKGMGRRPGGQAEVSPSR